jgi:hypothetical protein
VSHGHTASPVKFASCGGVRTVQAALKTPSCDSFRIPVRRSGQTRRVPKRKPDNAFSKTKNGIGHLVASRSQHGTGCTRAVHLLLVPNFVEGAPFAEALQADGLHEG